MKQKTAIIIGAGPAGLTAAYELIEKTNIKPIVYELTSDIGGICRTVNYKGNRMDIGVHRFFSKSERILQWWENILPLQGAPAIDDIILKRNMRLSKNSNAPDPEITDRVMLVRKRLTRILFLKRLLNYPISLNLELIMSLGLKRIIKITLSYLKACLSPDKEEKSLEDFFLNRFGKELYLTFFKDYSLKVWGVSCNDISPEWGRQRVKGLSFAKILINIISRKKQAEVSLINKFFYPKLGAGQMWQEVARIVKEKGGEIYTNHRVAGIKYQGDKIIALEVKDEASGQIFSKEGDFFFSTMPVRDLIQSFGEGAPREVRNIANGLTYRDFISVGLLLKKLKIKNTIRIKTVNNIIPDHWIYIQERNLKIARLAIYNNWSPYLVADKKNAWLGAEYFCNEGDRLWSMADAEIAKRAAKELTQIGFIEQDDLLDSIVCRMPKAYPVYSGTYGQFHIVKDFTERFNNLFLIGRNGMHRYNNIDHSMLSAMVAVENIVNNTMEKEEIWRVNTEKHLCEEKLSLLTS